MAVDPKHQQTISASLRQTAYLLPIEYSNVCRHKGHWNYHHAK